MANQDNENQQYIVINGDNHIDYYRAFGPFNSREAAYEAIADFKDDEEYGENMVRVIPLLTPEKLQEEIDNNE